MSLQRDAAGQPGEHASRWAAGLAAFFVVLAVAVNAGRLAATDGHLLAAAQASAGSVLDAFMVGVSLLGSVEVTGVAIAATVTLPLLRRRRLEIADIVPLVVIVAGSLIEVLGKTLVHQPPPPASLARGPRIGIGVATAYAFPSGHVFRATMVYGLWALRLMQQGAHLYWAWLCVGLVCLVGLSRVYLGQHWPTDVLGGALLGAAGLACSVAVVGRARIVPGRAGVSPRPRPR